MTRDQPHLIYCVTFIDYTHKTIKSIRQGMYLTADGNQIYYISTGKESPSYIFALPCDLSIGWHNMNEL